ncbi:TPA: hypothetical protein ACLASI_000750, partial [Neisseria meningitidis]
KRSRKMKEMKKPARSGQEKSGIIEISISELRYLMKYAAIATNASDEVRKGLIDEVQEWAISRLDEKTEGYPATREPEPPVRLHQDKTARPKENPELCQTESKARRLSVWTLNCLHRRAKCIQEMQRLEALILQGLQSDSEASQSDSVQFVIEIR